MLNKIKIAGGTGTKEDPIVIIADDEFTGVSSEYDYLENILGEQNVVWRLQEQMLMISKNKYYDVLNIELRNGEQRSYWFDITSFYGEGEKMNKYIFLLAILLNSKSRSKKHYSPDVVISDLFDTDLDEIDFVMSLSELELIYGFEIPNKLFDRTNITIGEYAYELSQLPLIPDNLYEEFYDIKITSMKLTKRFIELETKTDKDSLSEKCMIKNKFEELDHRLNNLL